jgi:hypothetical protein
MRLPILSICLSFAVGCGGSSTEPSIPPPAPMPEPPATTEPLPEPQPDPATGAYEPCAGKMCGETCRLCAPSDTDCVETAVLKQCNASGTCTHEPPACP